MGYEWLEQYLMDKPCVERDYKEEWAAYRYLLHGKMFAMRGRDKAGNDIITLKLEPNHGSLLRKEYPGKIVSGYYMNKDHWNSLLLDSDVPENVVRDMADCAYQVLLSTLPKKVQKEIGEA